MNRALIVENSMSGTKKGSFWLIAVSIVLVLTAGIASAAIVPQRIDFSGNLTNAAGTPLTGIYTVTFRLYTGAGGGTALATDTHAVRANRGEYKTTLNFPAGRYNGQGLWVGVQRSPDPEKAPRTVLSPVPYALGLRPGALIAGAVIVPAVNISNSAGVAVFGKGSEGAYFTTIRAGTGVDPLAAVHAVTSNDWNPGVNITTLGSSSRGVTSSTRGDYSTGLNSDTEGDYSDGMYAITRGSSSHGVRTITEGDSSYGVLTYTSGSFSHGVDASTSGPASNGVHASTEGDNSAGVYASTSGPSSAGVYARTSNASSEAVYAYTEGEGSCGLDATTRGDYSAGVVAYTEGLNSYGLAANTAGDYSTGVYSYTEGDNSPGISARTNGVESPAVQAVSAGDANAVDAWSLGNAVAVAGIAYNTTGDYSWGLYGETMRDDHKWGVYTNDYIYAGGIQAPAVDVAEYMPVAEDVTPGTVLIIGADGRLRPSVTAYDTRVAGIVSTAPGMTLGSRVEGNPGEETVAVAGRVPCRVDARYGAIHAGDLLATSDTPGHAMKVSDPRTGTVLGKALGSLERGTGTIEVLVTLQ